MKETLKKLLQTPSVSTAERPVAEIYKTMMGELGLKSWIDEHHNAYAKIDAQTKDAKTIMITAHADEIGLSVRGITEEGFVMVSEWAGIEHKALPGGEMVIHGKTDIPAVVGAKPPHLQKPGDKKAIPIEKIYLDTGLPKEKVFQNIKIGDFVSFKRHYHELLNDKVAGTGIDDKIGVAVLIEIAKALQKIRLEVNVLLVCTTQEEIGAWGAQRAAYAEKPDFGIGIDVTYGDQHQGSGGPEYSPIDKPVIEMGPIISEKTLKAFKDAASRINTKLDVTPFTYGTGTDADELWSTELGRPISAILVPIRYLHQPVEVADMKVASDLVKIVVEFLKGQDKNMSEVL